MMKYKITFQSKREEIVEASNYVMQGSSGFVTFFVTDNKEFSANVASFPYESISKIERIK